MSRVPRTYQEMNIMADTIIQLFFFFGIIGGITFASSASVKLLYRERDHVRKMRGELEGLAWRMNAAVQANDINKAFAIKYRIDCTRFTEVKNHAFARIDHQFYGFDDMFVDQVNDLLLKARMEAISLVNCIQQALINQQIVLAVTIARNVDVLLGQIRDIGGNTADLEHAFVNQVELIHAMQSRQEQQCRDELDALAATPIHDKDAAMARLEVIRDRAVKAGLIREHVDTL